MKKILYPEPNKAYTIKLDRDKNRIFLNDVEFELIPIPTVPEDKPWSLRGNYIFETYAVDSTQPELVRKKVVLIDPAYSLKDVREMCDLIIGEVKDILFDYRFDCKNVIKIIKKRSGLYEQ